MLKYIFVVLFLFLDSLSAKAVLILAATGELGSCISDFLCKQGYDLFLGVRDLEKGNKFLEELKGKYPARKMEVFQMNYLTPSSVQLETLKGVKLDGVVVIPPRPLFVTSAGIPTYEEWNSIWALTYSGPLEILKRIVPYINCNGSVVLICGITSEYYLSAYQNSNVIRLAWVGELKNLTRQFGAKKIRVNAVSPSLILTSFNKAKIQKRADSKGICFEEELKFGIANIPLEQYGQPQDVAKVVYFLLSDLASHVNGVNLPIDGGESLAY
jgi:3-oxoacyl-[acyl-carrier protein] reductase